MDINKKIDNNEILKISTLVNIIESNLKKNEDYFNYIISKKKINIKKLLKLISNFNDSSNILDIERYTNTNSSSEYIKLDTTSENSNKSFINNIKII